MVEPTLEDILQSSERLKGIIHPSPLVRSGYYSRLFGSEVFLKLENLRRQVPSRKGCLQSNRPAQRPRKKKQGVIAASAGNHAQGVAWAATRLGIRATVVMPEDVSLRKLLAVKEYGAEVILNGASYDDAYEHARAPCCKHGKDADSGL